jgi:hypothetical protein
MEQLINRICSRSNSIRSKRGELEQEQEFEYDEFPDLNLYEETLGQTEDKLEDEVRNTDRLSRSPGSQRRQMDRLFTEYTEKIEDRLVEITQQIQGIQLNPGNAHKRKFIIKAPDCLKYQKNQCTSVKRISELSRMFAGIASFEPKAKVSIRDFLHSINSLVTDLNCQISKQEFKHMLLSKLNLKSRTLLLKHSGNSLEDSDLDEIYAYLLLIYDTELTKHEALAKLSRNAGDYNTLSEFIEGISNLLDLSEIPDHARTIHFLDALRQTIDDTLYDKIIDWTQEYEITYGTAVPLTCLLDLLHRYKGSLNIAFAKKKQKVRVFNTMAKTEQGPQKERSGQISCGKCKSHTHLTDKCI